MAGGQGQTSKIKEARTVAGGGSGCGRRTKKEDATYKLYEKMRDATLRITSGSSRKGMAANDPALVDLVQATGEGGRLHVRYGTRAAAELRGRPAAHATAHAAHAGATAHAGGAGTGTGTCCMFSHPPDHICSDFDVLDSGSLAPLAVSPAQQVLPGNVMATCNAQLATTHRPRHCRRCALAHTSIIA